VLVGCGSVYGQYGNGYIPYNVILDTEGIVRYTASGFNPNAYHTIINQYMSVDFPVFSIQTLAIAADDNGDGRPDGGETVEYALSMRNTPIGVPGSNISVTMSCDAPSVTITNGTVTFPDAEPGQVIEGDAVFTFTVAEGIEPHWADFVFTYSADYEGGSVEEALEHRQRMGRPDLLLVDSDGAEFENEPFAINALDALGVEHDVWAGTVESPISSEELQRYPSVIWLGGRNQTDISASERAGLAAFLDNGGFLILSSQYASESEDNRDFLSDYFDVTVADTHGGTIFLVHNEPEDPWFGGSAFVATGTQGANNNVHPDVLEAGPEATVFGTWGQGAMGPAAVYTVREAYSAIFMGFPVEATRIHNSVDGSMNMQMFLERAFAFSEANVAVGDAAPAQVRDWRLLDAVPNPFNPSTTLRYELARAGRVELRVYNALGQQVALLQDGMAPAGQHEAAFDGSRLASGLYLVELAVDGLGRDVQKLMLVK
jgi:hypothetical protein